MKISGDYTENYKQTSLKSLKNKEANYCFCIKGKEAQQSERHYKIEKKIKYQEKKLKCKYL